MKQNRLIFLSTFTIRLHLTLEEDRKKKRYKIFYFITYFYCQETISPKKWHILIAEAVDGVGFVINSTLS